MTVLQMLLIAANKLPAIPILRQRKERDLQEAFATSTLSGTRTRPKGHPQ